MKKRLNFLEIAPMLQVPFFLLLLGLARQAFSRERPWTHYGLRPLGMGNVFVSVADDYNALFYNPAGLARLKGVKFEILNPFIKISRNTPAAAAKIPKLTDSSNPAGFIDFLEEQDGLTHYLNIGLTPYVVMPHFGLGIGENSGFSMVIHGRSLMVDLDVDVYHVLVPIGFAFNFLDQTLAVGASVKPVATTGVHKQLTIADMDALKKMNSGGEDGPKVADFLQSGVGIGADLGILFTPKMESEPTFGLSIMDFGGTMMQAGTVKGEEAAAPEARQPSLNAGVSVKAWKNHFMYVLLAAEAHSINQKEHYSKKFNMGVECGLGRILKVQTGLHQGNFTAGFQIDAWLLIIRLATYAEELGSYSGEEETLTDRRYAAQLKLLL